MVYPRADSAHLHVKLHTHLRDDAITHILCSVPATEGVDPLQWLPSDTQNKWLGYLSTTGVYGDYQGEWVDEQSELRPSNDRLKRRVAAENGWLARSGHVFRLAGIYGVHRNALVDIKNGDVRRVDKPGQVFSRIHVDDIAQTVFASMNDPQPSTVYNVCDDEAAPAHEVIKYGCELLGVESPPLIPFADAELSAMGREFYSANRRVSNKRIKETLGIKLYYPNYRVGLQALARTLQS